MSNSAAVSPKMLASPKIASPARVRHNPYGSPTSTPIDAASSLADSFATHPPQTPPMAAAPAATPWPTDSPQQRPVAAGYYNGEYHPPADPQVYGSFDHESMMGVGSFSPQPSYYSDVPAAYDAVDPSIAVAMYSAASAAAANAAAARVSVGYSQSHPTQRAPKRSAVTPSSESPAGGASWPAASGSNGVPRFEDVQAFAGSLIEHARTASGSSFIQTAVKESNDPRCLQLVWAELSTALGDLLLDAHGCYVIKTLLERLPADEVHYVLGAIAADEQLGFSICTHSLHTRRVVQHIIENVDGNFLCELMARHCADVAMTQQGCIVMQRSMDNAPAGPARDALFAAISANLVNFAKDPFANYVVQHVMEVGERIETTSAMWKAFRGRVVELACNKFASNVVEKCLFHCTAEIQHEMLAEMYSVGPQMLYNMLQDSFGNYIIQSSIALATFRDISMIDEALRPVLAHTPYGHKIEARLDRRLKGKPVSSRGPAPNASPATAPAPVANKSRQPASSKGRPDKRAAVPAGEVPW